MTENNFIYNDSRYPYTYACDAIRDVVGYNEFLSTKLSRSDAAQIRQYIANAIGMSDEELAKKISDKYVNENLS